jgi:hypothetical protein
MYPPSCTHRRVSGARAILLLALLSFSALPACATKRAYEGAARSDAEVAQIEPVYGLSGTQILLEAVDGVPLSWQHDRAAVLPGRHQLRASMILRSGLRQRSHRFDLTFDAEAGARYILLGELSAHGPRLWLTDKDFRTVAESESPLLPAVSARPDKR